MPVYEYECKKCGEVFDERRSVEDRNDPAKCVSCGELDTKRKFSAPHLIFMSDADLSARLMGVPKKRLDDARRLRADREKRKKDPQSQKDLDSGELHL